MAKISFHFDDADINKNVLCFFYYTNTAEAIMYRGPDRFTTLYAAITKHANELEILPSYNEKVREIAERII